MTGSWRSFLVATAGLVIGSVVAVSPTVGSSPSPSVAPSPAAAVAPDLAAFTWFEVTETRRGSELRVGRFDGWSRLVARGGHTIRADGPQDGLVAAVVPKPHGSSILLIDARTGETRRFLRTRDRVGDVLLDRANDRLWWVTQVDEAHAQLWRAPLDGGDPERVGDPASSIVTLLERSDDGEMLVLSGLDGEGGRFVRTRDVATGSEVSLENVSLVVGMLGDRVIDEADCSEICYPLRAIDPVTGADEVLAEWPGQFARMSSLVNGETVLIATEGDRYVAISADGTRVTLAATDGDTRRAVFDRGYRDAETPGYLLLVTDGGFVDERTGAQTVTDGILLPLDGSPAIVPGVAVSDPVRSSAASPGED